MKHIYKIITILVLLILFTIPVQAANKAIIQIEELNIEEINHAFDKGYLTSEQLVQLYLDRINTYDNKFNSMISMNEKALDTAKKLDKERKEKGKRSLMHGIPIIIKDNYDFVGMPTTAGAKALEKSYPVQNSFIVQKLIDAGAIILGKSNMSNFAFSMSSSISSYGTTHNAYNPLYSSYGSSGGSAVAVSSNFAVAALGTDTNSSIRTPASANGVVGLRPSFGLTSRTGILPYTIERDTGGPITRTVSDTAIIMDIIAGTDEEDSATKDADKEKESYTSYLNKDGLHKKRIGVIQEFISKNTSSSIPVLRYFDKDIQTLTMKAIEDMKDLGAEMISIENFYTEKEYNLFNATLDGFTFCRDLNNYFKRLSPDNTIQTFHELLNDGRFVYGIGEYEVSCGLTDNSTRLNSINEKKEDYRDYVLSIMKKYEIDAFVYPTLKTTLIKDSGVIASTSSTISPVTGFPSITVPMGYDSSGLPYGIQFATSLYQDGPLIEMAYAYEQATLHRMAPSITPSLYKVDSNITSILQLLERLEHYNQDGFSKISIHTLENSIQQAEKYILEYDTSTKESKEVLNNLKNSIEDLKIDVPIEVMHIFIQGIFILILILDFYFGTFLLLKLYQKHRRIKKKRKE